MQLQYDDDFVEGAVFVCASGQRRPPVPGLQLRRFHNEREKLYTILDPDDRNTAFFNLHVEWFREWAMEKTLMTVAEEFPLLPTALKALVFRKAREKRDEGAELYVRNEAGQQDRSAIVALRVERFARPEELNRFLRHEFSHIHDMVDPAFGYSPQLHLPGQNAAQQRLTRERYRLLWDITIDGRIAAGIVGTRSGSNERTAAGPSAAALRNDGDRWRFSKLSGQQHAAAGDQTRSAHVDGSEITRREQHRMAFERAFGFWEEPRRNEVFASLWHSRGPRHEELLAIASDPREVREANEPTPGAPCPLCGFATFNWASSDNLTTPTLAAIQTEFPQWTPDQGACDRCVEIYRIVASQGSGQRQGELLTTDGRG